MSQTSYHMFDVQMMDNKTDVIKNEIGYDFGLLPAGNNSKPFGGFGCGGGGVVGGVDDSRVMEVPSLVDMMCYDGGRYAIASTSRRCNMKKMRALQSNRPSPISIMDLAFERDIEREKKLQQQMKKQNVGPVKPTAVIDLTNTDTNEFRPIKKPRLVYEPRHPLLHMACRCGNNDEVAKQLRRTPEAAKWSISLKRNKTVYDWKQQQIVTKRCKEDYANALNLALQNNLEVSVIESLISAAPEILAMTDGPQQETPLHVALRYNRTNAAALVMKMLLRNPAIASIKDTRGNTPLHVACMYGASVVVFRHLCMSYPDAVSQRNFHGQTPMQLVQRNSNFCSDRVADVLWSYHAEHCEAVADAASP